jgi:hypothetical protein
VTGKSDFTEQEWELITEAPPLAGLMVATSQRGGTFREALSMGKAYADARKQHGSSELLDAVVGTRPKVDHERYHSPEELRGHVLGRLGEAGELLRAKGTEQEATDYTAFVASLAERVAGAHREGGEAISDAEQAALEAIKGALASPPAAAG